MSTEGTTSDKITSRSVGIRFGLYNAAVGIVLFVIAVILNDNPFSNLWNWIGIIIGIALVVYSHIQFKEANGGFMPYSTGVGISFWIGLMSTIISVPFLYIYLNFIDYSPFELFLRQQEDKLIESGMPDNTIEMSMTWTKNLFWPMACVMGIIGSVITGLIVSIFTQKKSPEAPV